MRTGAQFTLYNDHSDYLMIEAGAYGLTIMVCNAGTGKTALVTFEDGREVLESLLAMQFPLFDALGHDTEKAHDPS